MIPKKFCLKCFINWKYLYTQLKEQYKFFKTSRGTYPICPDLFMQAKKDTKNLARQFLWRLPCLNRMISIRRNKYDAALHDVTSYTRFVPMCWFQCRPTMLSCVRRVTYLGRWWGGRGRSWPWSVWRTAGAPPPPSSGTWAGIFSPTRPFPSHRYPHRQVITTRGINTEKIFEVAIFLSLSLNYFSQTGHVGS